MTFEIPTRYEECMLKIPVYSNGRNRIGLVVEDPAMLHTLFTNRVKEFSEWEVFYVRMPVCGNKTRVHVFNDENGLTGDDSSFTVDLPNVEILELKKRLDVIDISNPLVKAYVKFLIRFAYYAPELETNVVYQSDDGHFKINYVDYIIDYKTGKRIETTMRISELDGLIEVSKEFCSGATFPGIVALGLHEFAHFYLNDDMRNETEADLRGLMIYLGLGFPRVEAKEAFLETFIKADGHGADTPANVERYKVIERFIDDYENNKMAIYE